MSLLEKLTKAGSIKHSSTLDESTFFSTKDLIQTKFPIINVAMSGALDGGLVPGLTVLAGPSKHFKSNLGLIMVQAYMKQYEDAVCLFYDSEFGITPEYIAANGINTSRVIHIPIEHIEQLKFDIVKRLDSIERKDKVIIFIDSIGNLASKKEAEDALEEKSAADMTRAKQLKSLFRIITPHLTTKDLPCIAVNHVYQTQEMFSKAVVSGGTGVMYSSNTVWIIGRSQEKDGTEITGWNFNINVEKSRFVKEKSKLSFLVTYEGGINRWSGLMDLALESGHCVKPKNGWYAYKGSEKTCRFADTNNKEFWIPILTDKDFQKFVKDKYQLGAVSFTQLDEEE
jgi:RecA/RadA recombinase